MKPIINTSIRLLRLAALIFAIHGFGLASDAIANISEESIKLHEEAKDFLVKGNYKSAVIQLKNAIRADPNNVQARFDLAVALYGANQAEAAIDELIEIVRRERAWNDEAARKQLVQVFEALGHSHELTVEGRRRLSSVLFS